LVASGALAYVYLASLTHTYFLWNELKGEANIQTSYRFNTGDRVLNAQCLVETTIVYAFRH